ncbi:MAG: PAS domain-containing protein, partial [Thermodesulfobacteriota bacterium]
MDWHVSAVIATLFGCLMLSLIFLYIWLLYRESYLLSWAVATASHALFSGLYFVYVRYPGLSWPVTGFNLSLIITALFIMRGMYQFVDREWPVVWMVPFGLAVLLVLFAYTFDPLNLVGLAVLFLFLGLVQCWTGLVLLRYRPSDLGKAARRVTAFALILHGLHSIDFPFLRTVEWFAPFGFAAACFLQILIGFGLIFLYFNRNRSRLQIMGRQLEEARSRLEGRVLERTAELQRTVRALAVEVEERRRAEVALGRSEELFRRLVVTIPLGILELEARGMITYANPAAHRIYGFPAGELIGRSVFDLFSPAISRETLRDLLDHLLQ